MAKHFRLSPAPFARLRPLLPNKVRGWLRTGDCQARRPGEERVMAKQARDRFPAWRWWAAVGVVFVVGAVSGSASAEPLRSRWYIGGGLGVSGVHDMEERSCVCLWSLRAGHAPSSAQAIHPILRPPLLVFFSVPSHLTRDTSGRMQYPPAVGAEPRCGRGSHHPPTEMIAKGFKLRLYTRRMSR